MFADVKTFAKKPDSVMKLNAININSKSRQHICTVIGVDG